MPGRGLLRSVRATLPPPGGSPAMPDVAGDDVLLMTTPEFAARRGVTTSRIYQLIRAGTIPQRAIMRDNGRYKIRVGLAEARLGPCRPPASDDAAEPAPAEAPSPIEAPPEADTADRQPSPFFARMARIEARQGELIDLLTALHRRLDEWVGLGIGPGLAERLALAEGRIEGVAALAKDRLRPETVAAPAVTAPAPPPPTPELAVEHIAHLDRQADEQAAREAEQAAAETSLTSRPGHNTSPALDGWALEQILFNKPSGRFWTGHDGLEPQWSEDPAEARTFRTEALAEDARRFHKLTSWRVVELAERRHDG